MKLDTRWQAAEQVSIPLNEGRGSIVFRNVVKKYGVVHAVDGIDRSFLRHSLWPANFTPDGTAGGCRRFLDRSSRWLSRRLHWRTCRSFRDASGRSSTIVPGHFARFCCGRSSRSGKIPVNYCAHLFPICLFRAHGSRSRVCGMQQRLCGSSTFHPDERLVCRHSSHPAQHPAPIDRSTICC